MRSIFQRATFATYNLPTSGTVQQRLAGCKVFCDGCTTIPSTAQEWNAVLQHVQVQGSQLVVKVLPGDKPPFGPQYNLRTEIIPPFQWVNRSPFTIVLQALAPSNQTAVILQSFAFGTGSSKPVLQSAIMQGKLVLRFCPTMGSTWTPVGQWGPSLNTLVWSGQWSDQSDGKMKLELNGKVVYSYDGANTLPGSTMIPHVGLYHNLAKSITINKYQLA
jgi:hypothetical protein